MAEADPDDFGGGRAGSGPRPDAVATGPRSARAPGRRSLTRPAGAVNVHAHTLAGMPTPVTRRACRLVYVPDSRGDDFSPDGRHAIVVEEAKQTLAFRDPHTFVLQKALAVHCPGVDHMDFSADGAFAVASCEFSA